MPTGNMSKMFEIRLVVPTVSSTVHVIFTHFLSVKTYICTLKQGAKNRIEKMEKPEKVPEKVEEVKETKEVSETPKISLKNVLNKIKNLKRNS